MAMLEPKLAILDKTDSGLDIDALRIVANGVNKLKNANSSYHPLPKIIRPYRSRFRTRSLVKLLKLAELAS
jgi:hypothetical protein